MLRPPRSSLPEEDLEEEEEEEEEEDHYYGEDFTPSSSRKGEAGKVVGKKGNINTPRSKHSETEQRRRSKINERFQVLRDLIPQNDQKRDKASFLLEVIEYVHFLQEKLQMYEGAYHGYNQEPTKLTPWRNNGVTVDNRVEPAQVMRNGMSHKNNIMANLGLQTAAQNSLQPAIENSAVPMQMQSNMFASVGRGGISGLTLEPFPSTGNLNSHPQPQVWSDLPFAAECVMPNNSQSEAEKLQIENGSESLSSAYSQGVLNTLTQALQNSGVDLSQASVSVEIDVGKRANIAAASTSSNSMDHEDHRLSGRAAGHAMERSDDQPHKRPRTESN